MTWRVLLIEDDTHIRANLQEFLELEGFVVDATANGKRGLTAAIAHRPDVVLCDIRMPGMDGYQVLERMRGYPDLADVPFIFVTAMAQREDRRRGMALGADDYIAKPFELDEVLDAIRGRLARARRTSATPEAQDLGAIVRSRAHVATWERVLRVADTPLSILLLGETGVGKDVLAHAIHTHSPRAGGPFVPVHCAALAPGLLESELFGHEQGAFTGATRSREGLFEAADGGTLFLDEIGELSQETQVKLLRVLEDRSVRRVGGQRAKVVDVRFVAATHRDLEAAVREGRFREDLYYRLGMRARVPPLRERVEEIEPLTERFIATFCQLAGRPTPTLHPEVLALLEDHDWPGNVRELKHVVEQAAAQGLGAEITVDLLPEPLRQATPRSTSLGGSFQERVDGYKRGLIVDALEASGGNQSQAARDLAMPLRTLVAHIERFDLPRPRKK